MVREAMGAEWATAQRAASGAPRLSARSVHFGMRRKPARRVFPDPRVFRLIFRVR